MLAAVKRKVGIARTLEFSGWCGAPDYRVASIELKRGCGKYGVKPILVSFGAENARTIINNMAPNDWASFCEVDMAIENGVIILEGNIGAGKTTLAHKISSAIKRLGLKSQTHEEPASGTNPFLDDYYKDPKATAFKMQMFMLAKRFRTTMNAQCNVADDGGWHVLDRSYYGDICFANVQRKLGFFDENEFAVYLEHHRMMRTFLAMPSLAVFLKCGVARCQERICKRARACESGIEDSYLSALQSEIDDLERVLCRRCRTKSVDVSVDMNDTELDDLAERIAIDACMADSPDASFDYRGDWLVNRNDDDLKRLAQRENMA